MKKILIAAGVNCLFFYLGIFSAWAEWTNDPKDNIGNVTNQTGWDTIPLCFRLSSGNTFIVWERDQSGEVALKYQILDPLGNQILGPEGNYVLPTATWQYGALGNGDIQDYGLTSDGQGGVIVIFIDKRNGFGDIYGQHFDSEGNPLWGDEGLPLAVWTGTQDIYIEDIVLEPEQNDFFILWRVSPFGVGSSHVYAQKFNYDGDRLWGDYGQPIAVGFGAKYNPRAVSDGQGGFIVVWADGRYTTPYDPVAYLYAQHIDSNGNPFWAVNGIPLYYPGTSDMVQVTNVNKAVSDDQGGGIWAITAPFSLGLLKVFQINNSGKMQWIWSEPNPAYYEVINMVKHPILGTVWINVRAYGDIEYNLLYQFTTSGQSLFGDEFHNGGDTMTTTDDGVIIFKVDYDAYYGHNHYLYIKVLRINDTSNILWRSIVAIADPRFGVTFLNSVSDGANGAIVAFDDYRNFLIPSPDISAQRVQANGRLGNE